MTNLYPELKDPLNYQPIPVQFGIPIATTTGAPPLAVYQAPLQYQAGQLPAPGQPISGSQANVVSLPSTLCSHCKQMMVSPTHQPGHTCCQITTAVTCFLFGIFPGVVYVWCCCKKVPIHRCPNCHKRL